MRLLYLSADPGIPVHGEKGASIHVRALASALAALGHEVTVASPRLEAGPNQLPESIACVEIPAVRPRECASPEEVRRQALHQARVVQALASSLRTQAIYERYSLASAAGARASRALEIPLVLEVNAPLREEERRFRQLAHESAAIAAEQESLSAAARVVAVSGALARWLGSVGVDRSRIEVIPNAPPDHDFRPKRALAEDDCVVVGFSGGLKPWHGIGPLVAAFELALSRGARMRLEILGRGPAESLLEEAALPPERLTRLGHRPHAEALDVLEHWDVGVAPYLDFEGFYFSPLKLVEYMSAGLCPVVSDVGDLAATVEHGRAGVLVPPGDADALAGALVAVDRDRLRLRELGRRAHAVARALPTWPDNARRVVEMLTDALPAGSHASGVSL